jgi:hypothetical protein
MSITINNVVYNINSGTNTAYVSSSPFATGSITIESSVQIDGTTYSVTSIGNDAFINCSGLISVTIPVGVTTIGDSAFQNCTALINVTINNPSIITLLNTNSFTNVSGNLNSKITFYKTSSNSDLSPEWQTIAGYYANKNYLNYDNQYVNYSISSETTASVSSSPFATGSITILSSVQINGTAYSVTSIGNDAFINLTGLISVTIPVGVTTIGLRAFKSCSNLITVTLPTSGLVSIGDDAFMLCSALTSITIPQGVTSIGNFCFYYCTLLTSVTMPTSGLVSIGSYAFSDSSITSILIPDGVTSIGGNALVPDSLINVTINNPSIITSLETNSFENVSNKVNSNIYFFNTDISNNLSEKWKTIAGYYANKSYFSGNNPLCFNEGTKILCLNKHLEEEYIPIENLRKGDFVKSYKHGYRKIDLIHKNHFMNNPNDFSKCMYKMEKTNENGLLEDLIITGWHSILVDDLKECKEENDKIFGQETPKIDDKQMLLACVSKDFIKMDNTEVYNYYHFILENNNDDDERFGVWANGILSETPSKNQFMKEML